MDTYSVFATVVHALSERYSGTVLNLRAVVERDPRIAYALLFGSTARGTAHARQ